MPNTSSDKEIPTIVNVETEVVRLDPRGLIRNDIEFIRSRILPVEWKPGMTLEEVAFRQGQHELLRFIEQKVVGRRLS